MVGVLLDYWHRVTSVSHLWENDQLGASLFGPAGKIANFGKICFRITERTRNLGDGNFHSIVILSRERRISDQFCSDRRNRNKSEMFRFRST